MPRLEFPEMPARKEAPSFGGALEVIQNQSNDYGTLLRRQYKEDSYALESQYLTDQQFKGKMADLNAQYSNIWSSYQSQAAAQTKEIERIRTMSGRGEIDPQLGERAAWKTVLSSEAFAARYPERVPTTPTRPLSSSAVRSATALMGEIAVGAEDKRGLEWGEPRKTKEGLIEQYIDWRAQVGYDQLDPTHQNQLDMRWDALMKSDKIFRDWFSDREKNIPVAEVKSLRSRGRIGRAMQDRVVGAPARRTNVTPLGKSVAESAGQRKQPAQRVPSPEQLKAAGTREAYQQGVQLGYWR